MRDDLSAIFVEDGERNPLKSAQRDMKRPLPKRFYTDVSVVSAEGGGFGLTLDGKPVRTPARASLVVPTAGPGRGVGAGVAGAGRAHRSAEDAEDPAGQYRARRRGARD